MGDNGYRARAVDVDDQGLATPAPSSAEIVGFGGARYRKTACPLSA